MNFGEQIKRLRTKKNITQQQMADKIGVSRQAISNWENDRNLPDIEMLIIISQTFNITLDELILGGREKNNMTEKLIKDASENRRTRMSVWGIGIGAAILVLGIFCWIIAAFVPVSAERYFGTAFSVLMLCGIFAFIIVGMQNVVYLAANKERTKSTKLFVSGGAACILGTVMYAVGLFIDSNAPVSSIGIGLIAVGIILFISGLFSARKEVK